MSVTSIKSKTALSVCVALSVTLLAQYQTVEAKQKSRSYKQDRVQIAALPFFKKDSAKDSKDTKDASKDADIKKSDKASAADTKKAAAAAKVDKKKGKETADKGNAEASKKADQAAADAKAASEKAAKAEATAEKAEAKADAKNDTTAEEKAPAFAPDASLISVLKDLSKALKDPEQVQKLSEEANHQAVIAQAQTILARSLENSELTFNRIISTEEERQVNKALTPESWASGEVNFADGTGSLTAVWAKRVNGLLNLTIAGKCKDKLAPNGKKIGNFVVVITGRSPIEAGFDIQTQSNVNFWLGQLASATIDSDCLSDVASGEAAPAAGEDSVKKKSLAALPILVTDRVVAYKRDMTAYEIRRKMLAQKAEEEQKAKDERNQLTAQAIAEATAKVLKESTNRSLTKDETLAEKSDELDEEAAEKNSDEAKTKVADKGGVNDANKGAVDKTVTDKGSEKNSAEKTADRPAVKNADSEAALKDGVDKGAIKPVSAVRTKTAEAPEVDRNNWSSPADKVAMTVPTTKPEPYTPPSQTNSPSNNSISSRVTTASTTSTAPTNQSVWESPAGSPTTRMASLNATIVIPEKAVAGQFLTTSIIDKDKNGESSVELSFNGSALATDARGQALYMVPEDATPGRSLNVCLASRPEYATYTVDILQPLSTSYEPQVPKIDKITPTVTGRQLLVIEGHNFDGHADHNRILIDGFHEAKVIAASPVQIKAMLPAGIRPGSHSLCVGNAGMRSNSAPCDVIAAEVQQDPKELGRENMKNLLVKVIGTNNKVNVRLTNNTPDVLRISRGTDSSITTSGGLNNTAIVGVQRLKKGAYNVEAVIEQ